VGTGDSAGRCAGWAPEVAAAFGTDSRLLRQAGAVHEAGHALVAATTGFTVTRVRAGDPAVTGGHGTTDVDTNGYGDRPVPLPDLLAGLAAGVQATCTWLRDCGVDANQPPYASALNVMAAPDIAECQAICRQVGRPWLTMQHGIEGAWWILTRRWPAVLALANALTTRSTLAGADLQPFLSADPAGYAEAISAYGEWRRRTSRLWRRQPGEPAEVLLSEPDGRQDAGSLPGGHLPRA
jgi:hypothetical protein